MWRYAPFCKIINISAGVGDDIIKIVVSEEYDLEPQEKTMSCSDIVDKIMTSYAMRIYY